MAAAACCSRTLFLGDAQVICFIDPEQ